MVASESIFFKSMGMELLNWTKVEKYEMILVLSSLNCFWLSLRILALD